MVVERRPRPRVRVFGCCLPIPLGLGLLSMGGLALLVRRQGGNRPGHRDLLNPTCWVSPARTACVAAVDPSAPFRPCPYR